MCSVIPFRAVRPAHHVVQDVASYPYDIINSSEAREIARDNENSFLHVVKSEIDLPVDINMYDEKVYEKARENFYEFLDRELLLRDHKPCFYIYRQQMGSHQQYGIVACVSVDEYESGRIKKHELTRADKEADRTRHIATVNAQTGPVFLTYKAQPSIDETVEQIVAGGPEYDFTADDGISHTVWVVDNDGIIEKLRKEFLTVDSLYIADGHHRAASAAAVSKMRRQENPGYSGNEEYNSIMAVIFPHNQLKVLDYNRVVRDLNGLSETEYLEKVSEYFLLDDEVTSRSPEKLHEFGMYVNGRWYAVRAKEELYRTRDVIDTLDVSILQEYLLKPILGINDLRTDERIIFVGGIRGVDELERLVDSGDYSVAFALHPTTLEQMMSVADQGKMMPPKSTWFEPKLRSGLFVHLLE